MTKQAHRTVVLYENGIEIAKGSAVMIASFFYNPRTNQQAEHSRLVSRLANSQNVNIDKDGRSYKLKPVQYTPPLMVEQYEKAKSLYRRNNKEASREAKECRKLKTGSPEWMEHNMNMLKAQAGARIAKEWMERYKDGDMTYNHKSGDVNV